MAELKDKAPSWKAAAKAYVSKTGMYCAEDGALFNAETAGAAITNGKCTIVPILLSEMTADDAS